MRESLLVGLTLVDLARGFYPDAMGLHGTGARAAFGQRNKADSSHEVVENVAIWVVIPFVLIVVFILAFMIWLVISDEKADSKKRELDKRAKGLKYGRSDPRYVE